LDSTALLSKMQVELRNAIAAHYADLTREFDDICGYAVCAPSTFEQVFPAYQLASELARCSADSLGITSHFPPEWNSFGTIFFDNEFNSLVAEISGRWCGEDRIEPATVFDAMLKVFTDLEREGAFGPRSPDRFLTICEVGSDESMIIAASEKLNSPELHSRVLRTFGRST
jgi:hypothetical protein